jgi:hypothetical protein
VQKLQQAASVAPPRECTLLELVRLVNGSATSDAEIVATVASLINSGKVRLCGTFAGARIDLATPAGAASSPPSRLLDSPQKWPAGKEKQKDDVTP